MTRSDADTTTEQDESRTLISRRGAIKGASVAAGAGAIGMVGMWYGSQPALAAQISAWGSDQDTVSITTHDGSINEVLIDPLVDIDWSGFNEGEYDIDVYIDVSLPDDSQSAESVLTHTLEGVGTSGEETDLLDTDQVNVLGMGTITADTFEEGTHGATNGTTMEVSLRVDAGHPDVNESVETDSVTVEVTNATGEVNGSGSFSAALESDEEVTDGEQSGE